MACTATAARSIVKEVMSILEMREFVTVSLPSNQPNIMQEVKEVKTRTDPEVDLSNLLSTLRENLASTPRVIAHY